MRQGEREALAADIGAVWPGRLAELHPRRFFLETWQRIDAEAAAEREARSRRGEGYDWRPLIMLCSSAVLLTLMEYWGDTGTFRWVLDRLDPKDGGGFALAHALRVSPFAKLGGHAWWAAWRVAGFLLLPAVAVRLTGERLRDQGLGTRGLREHAWIYVLGYLVVLACVVAVSFDPAFVAYYPFYKLSSRSWADLLAWELMYGAQFFALELFFRGWWLRACRTMMGSHAIFVMTLPYCMIHFGKPMPEVLGAIIAGVFLGTLAMRTRSIWSGFLIHVSVAVSMDVAALLRTTGLPTALWPG